VLDSRNLWSAPVHPTQIYESVCCLLIAVVCLVVIHPRKRYDGQVFAAFLALYAVTRFLLETLRRDDRGAVFGLSTSQFIGLLLVAAAVMIHASFSRQRQAASA
jgi:phosphatidylglycerol:prolipoprotein diacylglycerol transferase